MKIGVSNVLVKLCVSLFAVQAQRVPAPEMSVGPAEGPSELRVDDRHALAPRSAFLQQQVYSNFQGNFSEPQGYVRDEKYILPEQPADSSFAPVENQTLAARTESSGNVGFVTTNGINFVLNGKIKYFSGSNDYFLIMRRVPSCKLSKHCRVCVCVACSQRQLKS